jgi:hypothetical protein
VRFYLKSVKTLISGLLLLPLSCRFSVKKGFVQIRFPLFVMRSRENFKKSPRTEAFFAEKFMEFGNHDCKTQRIVAAIRLSRHSRAGDGG